MLDKARPAVKPIVELMAKPFLKVNPNVITVFGLVMAIVYVGMMAKASYGWAMVFFLGSLADMLDGTVARMTGKVTEFGAVWDATLDRFTDGLMLMAFAIAGLVPWVIMCLLIVTSIVISYVRARYEATVKDKDKLAVGIIERPERLMVIGACTLLMAVGFNPVVGKYNLVTWVMGGLLLLSLVTVGQRLKTAYERLMRN